MNKIKEKDDIQNLLLTIRVVSILSLFETIFILSFVISYLFDKHSVELISKLNIDGYDVIYKRFLPVLIGMFVIYVGGVFINYYIIKNNNKYSKKILIGEIVLLIIYMTGLFLSFSRF